MSEEAIIPRETLNKNQLASGDLARSGLFAGEGARATRKSELR